MKVFMGMMKMKHIKKPESNKEYKIKLQHDLKCSICPPHKGCNASKRSKPKGIK